MHHTNVFILLLTESAERERREALLRKNQDREEKIFAKKKAQNSQTYFAFGSCTPRMGYSMSGEPEILLLNNAFEKISLSKLF